jgi:hypothetical protein
MTLVWGYRSQGTPNQKQRAKWLFEELGEDEAQIVLPSVALSEYLTPVDPKKHRDVIARLNERFIIASFDVTCAGLAASLFSQGKPIRKTRVPETRKILRADCLIIASAAMFGAREFYSGDMPETRWSR